MKKLLCLFLSLLVSFQVFAFEVFETEKNKSYLFEDYKHLVREFDDFCYYADLPISSEDVVLILMQRIDGEVYATTTVYKLTAIVEERVWIFE